LWKTNVRVKNRNFCQKKKFASKIEILVKNWKKFLSKIEILVKNKKNLVKNHKWKFSSARKIVVKNRSFSQKQKNSCQKSKFWSKLYRCFWFKSKTINFSKFLFWTIKTLVKIIVIKSKKKQLSNCQLFQLNLLIGEYLQWQFYNRWIYHIWYIFQFRVFHYGILSVEKEDQNAIL